jgi:hypothetical protein
MRSNELNLDGETALSCAQLARREIFLAACVCIVGTSGQIPQCLGAQSTSVTPQIGKTVGNRTTIEGVALDSLHNVPWSGATIVIQDLATQRADTTIADDNGHFHATVPGGRRYQLSAADSLSDLLGLQITATLLAQSDSTVHVALALPSSMSLARLMCGPAGSDSGAVAGRVTSHGNKTDLRDATVSITWVATEVNVVARRVASVSRIAIAHPDRDGHFAACGLPIPLQATLVVQIGTDSVTQDVSLTTNRALAPTSVNLPFVHGYASGSPEQATDPASNSTIARSASESRPVTVTVLTTVGQPVPRAQVTLDDHARFLTDTTGVVKLWPGAASAHRLVVRKLGFAPLDVTSALTGGSAGLTLHLRAVIPELESVNVTAPGNRARSEFALRARTGIGDYFTEADIERLKPDCLLDLLKRLPGVQVEKGIGCHGGVSVFRGAGTINGDQAANGCVHLVVDGGPASGYDSVPVDDIIGVEFYDEVDAPIRYGNQCAVIEVWTKQAQSIY